MERQVYVTIDVDDAVVEVLADGNPIRMDPAEAMATAVDLIAGARAASGIRQLDMATAKGVQALVDEAVPPSPRVSRSSRAR